MSSNIDLPMYKTRRRQNAFASGNIKYILILLFCLMFLSVQIVIAGALYQIYIGPYEQQICHINSSSVQIDIEIDPLTQYASYFLTARFLFKNDTIYIDKTSISALRLQDLLVHNPNSTANLISVEFTVDIIGVDVQDVLYTYDSLTCYTRYMDSNLYVENTDIYGNMTTLLLLLVPFDLILVVLCLSSNLITYMIDGYTSNSDIKIKKIAMEVDKKVSDQIHARSSNFINKIFCI